MVFPCVALIPAAILNYRTRRSFVTVALFSIALVLIALVLVMSSVDREGHRVAFGSLMNWALIPACLLEGLALLLLAAIAISLSTRLATASTVAILLVLLFTGLVSDHLTGLLASVPPAGYLLTMILPDIQGFWPADTLAGGGSITGAIMGHATVYAAAYGSGVLCLGYAAFRNRQF